MAGAISGNQVYIQWCKEATYLSGAIGTSNRQFGLEQKVSGLTYKNNQLALGTLNSPEIACFAYPKNEGSMTVDWILTNPWIFDFFLAAVTNSGATSDFTHIWATTPGTSVIAGGNDAILNPNSMTMEIGENVVTDADITRLIKGAVMDTLTLKATVGEMIKMSAGFKWGYEHVGTPANPSTSNELGTALDATVATDDFGCGTGMSFANAVLELPDGTVVALIQELELTFNGGVDLLWGIGSKAPTGAYRKIFELTGKFKANQVDKVALQRVYDASTGVTASTGIALLQVTITNGLATTAEKAIILDFGGVGISEHSTDLAPGELVFDNLTFQMRTLKVTANNSIAVPPVAI